MVDINDTFDEESYHSKVRRQLMSDEQQRLAEKVQNWYRDAYRDKDDRGVFEKMETAELYWEGDAHPPVSDTDPASNTNIVNATIEGQVAYLVEQNIGIEAKPRGPSDLAFRDKAVNLMEWCRHQNRMRRKLDVHERRRKKFGVGYWRVLFDPDLLDGMGLPWIEPVNPAYCFPDPVVTDIYKIQQGRFFIEGINRSIESAREKFGEELADAIEPGYVPMEFSDIFDEMEERDGEIADDHYLHWLVWTHAWIDDPEAVGDDDDPDSPDENMPGSEDGDDAVEKEDRPKKKVLRLIEMSACGVILRDTLEQEVLICENDQRFPYFPTPDMYREGSVWPKSTAELLIKLQDKIDDIDDQIIINGRLTGNPQRILDVGSSIDPDKVDNDGGLLIMSAYEGGMKYLKPPEMPQYIIAHRDKALSYERSVISRWSDQMNGIKQTGVDTATESLGLQQAGTQSINHDKMLLEETLGEVFEYCLLLMMENYTEEETFLITEKGKEQFMAFNPSSLLEIPKLIPASEMYKQQFVKEFGDAAVSAPDWMPHPDGLRQKIALDIEVKVGAGLPSNKAFIYQMLKEDPDLTPQERRRFKKEYLGLPIDEMPEPPPQPPAMPGQPMQNPTVAGVSAGGVPLPPNPGGM